MSGLTPPTRVPAGATPPADAPRAAPRLAKLGSAADGSDDVARHLAAGRRTGLSASAPARTVPNAARIARRRFLVRGSKFVLPLAAIALLGSIAVWPEIDRAMRFGARTMHDVTSLRANGGEMTGARYQGVDSHGRPYTITAASARQVNPDRVDLVWPKADIVISPGRWVMLTADRGVYAPHSGLLALAGHVFLYRDDGTMLTGPTATIDIRRDVDASADWVHIEGPFGQVDAPRYFMAGHDGVIQFDGPARMVLNDTRGSGAGPGGGAAVGAAATPSTGAAAE